MGPIVDNQSTMRLLLLTLFIFLGIISKSCVEGYDYGGFRRGLGYGRFNPPPEVAVNLGSIQNRREQEVNSNPYPWDNTGVSVFHDKGSDKMNNPLSNYRESAIEESLDPNEKLSENLPTTSGMHKMVQGRNIPLINFIRRITLFKYHSYTTYIWLF